MNYIAFVTRGLEQVAAAELSRLLDDLAIVEIGAKRIMFATAQPAAQLITLRTVDDLCLLVAKVEPVTDLETLRAACAGIDFNRYRDSVGEYRALDDRFSITPSLAGLKEFTAPQLVEALRDDLARRYPWSFSERDHTNFDLRVFIDRTQAYIAVRLTAESLMHRSYKIQSKPGSLRPTVAAAMIQLAARDRRPLSIVDDFCGSGTILCEAALLGHTVSGGDIDPQSVAISQANLSRAGFRRDSHVRALDATRTRWPDSFYDCAISNLPWGKQVDLRSIAELFAGAVKEYARIVKDQGTLCLLTPRPEPLIKYARTLMKGCRVSTLPISFTGQSPTIVVVERR